jgi:hypothetical protein
VYYIIYQDASRLKDRQPGQPFHPGAAVMKPTERSPDMAARLSRRELIRSSIAVTALSAAGCAAPVPGTVSQLTGYRLRATVNFNDALSGSYYYFVLINNRRSSTPQANGAIPVGGPISGTTYGNGFATGSTSGTSGFTDIVLYGQQLPIGVAQNNTAIYHVIGEDTADLGNANYFDLRFIRQTGNVLQTSDPINSSSPATASQLIWEIDLGQLTIDPTTNLPYSSSATRLASVRQMTWLQINIVATNILPRDPQTAINKQYDSMGNNNQQQDYYIGIPVFLNGAFQPGSYPNLAGTEVTGDVQPPGSPQDPKLDMTGWQFDLFQSG